MLFKATLFAAALAGVSTAAPLAGAIPGAIPVPNPGGAPSGHEVEIVDVKYSGSGCKPGSAASLIDASKTTMTISYSDFIAQSGPGIQPKDNRKNCNLTIKLKYPAGWQYSIFSTEFRGYADLAEGDRGECKATYWFSGESQQIQRSLVKKGPFHDNYQLSDVKGLETTVWSPCGQLGMLNINSEVRIVPLGTKNSNLMTVDTTDLKFDQLIYFQWQKC